jgi:C1A family cysteine protease
MASLRAVIIALALGVTSAALLQPRATYEAKFFDHVKKFGLEFATGEEFAMRLEVFAGNDDTIESHNNGPESTYTLGHNEYSHLTWSEFQTMFHLGQPYELKKHGGTPHTSGVTADSWNWDTMGKVTPVKNQGNCGSCWSFSATGSLEGSYAIAQNMNISDWSGFSEQQLVSCDKQDSGCNGGLMDTAFTWIKGNGGICSEADYPYTSGTTGSDGSCQSTCQSVGSSSPAGYTDVDTTDAAMQSAITQQPVSVAIQANQPAFQMYSGGVLTGRCGDRLDHGVLAVGYGTWTDGTTEYWTVKNSWGASWGMAGYILIEKGGDAPKGGECGILEMASYPNM